ncbi:hypothetical protein BB559_003062 [Furculomyces boomerangus]|uniref:Uncharacterized protein n=2 Tax=Harpellales TaxID=61421 RepID=A0A2T9YPH8_9FUNG|nr:hypothetical protein BB559_003062 [Furculomyces boomerangus]PVZ96590.1 hypothetical protein BB558_007493 [Smittium angustum]
MDSEFAKGHALVIDKNNIITATYNTQISNSTKREPSLIRNHSHTDVLSDRKKQNNEDIFEKSSNETLNDSRFNSSMEEDLYQKEPCIINSYGNVDVNKNINRFSNTNTFTTVLNNTVFTPKLLPKISPEIKKIKDDSDTKSINNTISKSNSTSSSSSTFIGKKFEQTLDFINDLIAKTENMDINSASSSTSKTEYGSNEDLNSSVDYQRQKEIQEGIDKFKTEFDRKKTESVESKIDAQNNMDVDNEVNKIKSPNINIRYEKTLGKALPKIPIRKRRINGLLGYLKRKETKSQSFESLISNLFNSKRLNGNMIRNKIKIHEKDPTEKKVMAGIRYYISANINIPGAIDIIDSESSCIVFRKVPQADTHYHYSFHGVENPIFMPNFSRQSLISRSIYSEFYANSGNTSLTSSYGVLNNNNASAFNISSSQYSINQIANQSQSSIKIQSANQSPILRYNGSVGNMSFINNTSSFRIGYNSDMNKSCNVSIFSAGSTASISREESKQSSALPLYKNRIHYPRSISENPIWDVTSPNPEYMPLYIRNISQSFKVKSTIVMIPDRKGFVYRLFYNGIKLKWRISDRQKNSKEIFKDTEKEHSKSVASSFCSTSSSVCLSVNGEGQGGHRFHRNKDCSKYKENREYFSNTVEFYIECLARGKVIAVARIDYGKPGYPEIYLKQPFPVYISQEFHKEFGSLLVFTGIEMLECISMKRQSSLNE